MENSKPFDLDFNGIKIRVHERFISGTTVYMVQFEDKRAPLVVTRATNANAARWWTSIPEGRQSEAEKIGPLIAEYIKSNQ